MKTYCEAQIETNKRRFPCRDTRWCFAFSVAWMVVLLTFPARADQFGDFTYETNASAAIITAYTGSGGNVIVPATIAGLPVASIGSSAFANRPLTSISLPNSVTRIEEEAFYGCTGLTSIALPNSLISLGIFAFAECSALTNINIPSSVTNIGEATFVGCTALRAINVDALNPIYSSADGVLFDKAQTLLIVCPAGKVGSYTLPDSVTVVGDSAFYECAELTSVTLPNVTSIGLLAFQECSRLIDVTLPNSLTSIGEQAFLLTGLTRVAIPRSVTNIAPQTFAFTKLTSVTVPDSITKLGDRMFRKCPELTTVILPASLTSIDDFIFQDNSEQGVEAVTGVYFKGNAPTNVGTAAFRGANNATVYYRAGTTGWGSTLGGRPTALWVVPTYSEWAQSFGLPTRYPNANGELDDADQDGLANIQEMQAGTDPTDPGSTLRMEQQPRPGDLTESDQTPPRPNQFALYFQSIPGKIYELRSAPTLGSPWKPVFTLIASTPQKRVLLSKSVRTGFYRVFLSP
jgi:hypothetical protein